MAADFGMGVDQLAHARGRGHHQIVRQDHGEGLVVDQVAGAPHGVAQAQRLLLAGIGDLTGLRHPRDQRLEFRGLVPLAQRALQIRGMVEMILEGRLATAGDEDEMFDAGGGRFLDRVLDQRLIDHRQHFLGHRLGGGQEPGAETSDRKHAFADTTGH